MSDPQNDERDHSFQVDVGDDVLNEALRSVEKHERKGGDEKAEHDGQGCENAAALHGEGLWLPDTCAVGELASERGEERQA